MEGSVFSSIQDALIDFAKGEFLIVCDDEDRENEGDLIIAAEKATEAKIAFMIHQTGGVVCVATTEARLNELELPQMVHNNTDPKKTAFTITTDYKIGTSTGISAGDRAITISAIANPNSRPQDFQRPGHVFPLRYSPGGVLNRAGHTEAAVDLCRLSNLYPAGALSEIMDENGKLLRRDELAEFSKKYNIKMITIDALIKYRYSCERLVNIASLPVDNPYKIKNNYGDFNVYLFQTNFKTELDVAYTFGDISKGPCLVRIQKECIGGLFGSCGCYRKAQLTLKESAKFGRGVLILIRSQTSIYPHDIKTNEKALLDIGIGAQILRSLNVGEMRLLTTSLDTVLRGVEGFGLKIIEKVLIKKDDKDDYFI